MEPMDLIVHDIKRLMMSIEIFLKGISDSYETIDTKIAYGTYKRAYNKKDTFETYRSYDPQLLLQWGITENAIIAHQWGEDPTLIPSSLRSMVLINQRNHIVRTYVEGNEYIRVRIGLPTLQEMEREEFVYASEIFNNKFKSGNKPLHLFTDVDFVRLKNSGEYKKILIANPEKKYLKYIGLNKLNHFVLKEAKNFDLISYDTTLDDRLLNDFLTIYSQMRHYTVNVLYVHEFSKQYPHYDSYMSLLMTVMTIQRLIANVFRNGIDRDYYDLFNLQMLFESHNTPFMKELPMDYQRVMARNLNRLLRMKSTDKVLYDVAELLGFENSEFFKYYLVKQHKLDEDGLPLVLEKTIIDENLEEKVVPDYENMYELYFQGVKFDEDDVASALGDVANRMSYQDMVIDDDFWWSDDSELMKVLHETEFNIIETKYFGVQSMYRITEMVHEVARFFRLLLDNKDTTKDIFISLPKILSEKKLSFFEVAIFAICLVCKRNKSKGEIISSPSKTLSVIGFNFRADFDLIREHLEKNRKYIESDKIAQYILDIEVFTLKDINRVYGNIKELWEFLVDKMSRSSTIEEYEAYDKLYKTLMYTDDMAELFTLPDGTIAETYFDFLYHLNAELYVKLETATETQIFEMLEHIVYSLEDDLDNLEYLSFLIGNDGIMEEAFRKFIMFLKSYTIDLKSMSIIYLFDNRKYNMIKLIDQIDRLDVEMINGTNGKLQDIIKIFGKITHKEDLKLREEYELFATIFIKSLYKLRSEISIEAFINLVSKIDIYDTFTLNSDIIHKEDLKLREDYNLLVVTMLESLYKLKEKLSIEARMILASKFDFADVFMLESNITSNESIKLEEDLDFIVLMTPRTDLGFRYDVTVAQINTVATRYEMTDFMMINSNILAKTDITLSMKHAITLEYLLSTDIKLKTKDEYKSIMQTASYIKFLTDNKNESEISDKTSLDIKDEYGIMSNIQHALDTISDIKLDTESNFGIATHMSLLDYVAKIQNIINLNTKKLVKMNISQAASKVYSSDELNMKSKYDMDSLANVSNRWGIDSILGTTNTLATVKTSSVLKDSVLIKREE